MAFENESGLWDFQSSEYCGIIGMRSVIYLVQGLWADLFVECGDILINLWAVLNVSPALHSSARVPVHTGKVTLMAMEPSQPLVM